MTSAPLPHRADVRVDARPGPDDVRVPADYLGLSVEWSMVEHWFGTSRESASPVTAALLASLQRDRSTAGVLRVGGNSQDGYVWRPDGSLQGNTLFTGTVTRGLVDAVLEVARRSGWKVVLGLDLRADDPGAAAALAAHAAAADTGGSLLALEIGNEPNAWAGPDVDGWLARFTAYADAVAAGGGGAVAGPAVSHQADLGYVRRLREAAPDGLGLITWHHYANQPTRAALLADSTRAAFAQRVVDAAAAAGGLPHRMGEGNSVGSGGIDGVSNVLTAATWLVDALLTGAAAGLPGFHLHAWDGVPYPAEGRTCWYTPFVVRDGAAFPRPPFYGLALARHVPGRTFRRTTVTVAAGGPVGAHALVDPATGRLYVYVLDRSGSTRAGTVSVTAPPGHTGRAWLSRLGDAGGCGGRTTGINGEKLPAGGAYTWAGTSLRPAPGTTRYDVVLGPCEVLLLSLGRV